MTAFFDAINFFLAGFVLGLFGPLLYKLILKIIEEFKLAKQQWRGDGQSH
jgi:H+/Cl- antiporter ClcA